MNSFPEPPRLPLPPPPPSCTRRRSSRRAPASGRARPWILGLLAFGVAACLVPLLACGPFFPNSLLLEGDAAVLQAPSVSFRRELDRLSLPPPPRLVHVPSEDDSPRPTTLQAEILDLRRALAAAGRTTNEIAAIVLAYSAKRADLEEHLEAVRQWNWERENAVRDSSATSTEPSRPAFELGSLPAGVPREFDLYLQGATAWHRRDPEAARLVWTALLALPPAERRFKSTWAAFMLGRSWHDREPAKATAYYEQTLRLARSQFSDSAGLGVAALGWMGQLRLRTNDLHGALALYLDQYAAGATNSALVSLQVAARAVLLAPPEQRLAVARDPAFRRVVNAWLLADDQWAAAWNDEVRARASSSWRHWLETLERVHASEVPLAEQLAVLAYQVGDWEEAGRWVELSGDSPVASWIDAKLLLRQGKIQEAAQRLATVVDQLPLDPPAPVRGQPPEFVDSLYAPDSDFDNIPGRRQALGELGVLRLTRGEFVQSLDALLRAGFWQDAAYVAERVLRIDELKPYVDTQWPPLTGKAAAEEALQTPSDNAPRTQRERIRHLLARRLTRVHRGQEAVSYLPEPWRPRQLRFLALLRGGEDTSRPPRERAHSWMAAAWIARTNGLELLATELAPDAAIWDGQFEAGPDPEERRKSKARLVRPSAAELARADAHRPEPDERFHYRYQAAALAWEAARLLPNNDPETALALYHGGSWLKVRDPKTADVFYKTLVRRCRQTPLGEAANRLRWFPELDDLGNPVVTRTPNP